MGYDIKFKRRAIEYKNEGHTYKETCKIFKISESNIKKRFYRNLDVLNKDYEAVERIKEKLEAKPEEKEIVPEITSGYAEVLEPMETVKVETFKRKKGKKAF